MSTEQNPPIVTDAGPTKNLSDMSFNDRDAYITSIRQQRATEVAPVEVQTNPAEPQVAAPVEPAQDPIATDIITPTTDATDPQGLVVNQENIQADGPVQVNRDDLNGFLYPVPDGNGGTQYLSYEEIEKGAGLYNKQNERARDLAKDREELDGLKKKELAKLSELDNHYGDQVTNLESANGQINQMILWAQANNKDVVQAQDGNTYPVVDLVRQGQANSAQITLLGQQKAVYENGLKAQEVEYKANTDKYLTTAAPHLMNNDNVSKVTNYAGSYFSENEANSLMLNGPLRIIMEKAMKYDAASKGTPAKVDVRTNTQTFAPGRRTAGGASADGVTPTQQTALEALAANGKNMSLNELRAIHRGLK